MYTLGNLVPAIEQVRAARRFHADAGALLEELEDVLLEGEYAMRSGDRAGSTAAIARARAIAAKVGSRVARVELALGEARVAELVNDPAAVLRATSRVRDDLRTATTGRAWEAPALAARAHAAMRHWAEAVASGRDAVREIERVRANFVSGSLRASFTSDRANVYGDLVLALLALGRTDEALAVADAARSRALLEHLAAAGTNVRRGVATEMAEADRLLRRIGQLTEHLRMADTATPRRRGRVADNEAGYLSGELVRVRREYETLLQRTTVGDRRAAILMGADTPDTKAIQAALGPQEAVLEYLVLADRLITFVIRPLDVHALSQMLDVSVLSLKVRLARDLVGTRNIHSGERDPILRALHGVLVAPAARAHLLNGVSRLIIVPHAALTYLPFAALIDPATSQYVIDQYDLLTLPSGASLVAVRGGDRGAANAFVSVNVFAPLPDGLPGTLAESKALQRIDRGARTHVGSEATERALRASLGDSFPVHVATHGVLNARNPMFSHLELTRPDMAPVLPEDDGRLEVHELLDLTIRSPLVFLSGCETGKGMSWSTSFTRGEDYATLSEAFLFAGARNVVSTLWRIEDTSAAEFAKAFYSALPNGDPVTALARAQRGMRADRAYASPYYWAAYVVSGAGIGGSAQGGRRLSVK